MERTEGAFSPEDRIGALALQNLTVSANRALLLRCAEGLAPVGGAALEGLLGD